ncbi:MAG: hypothetical protein ACRCU9_07055 [Iodobacter sp.]
MRKHNNASLLRMILAGLMVGLIPLTQVRFFITGFIDQSGALWCLFTENHTDLFCSQSCRDQFTRHQ